MSAKIGKKTEMTEAVRECTINLHKRLYNMYVKIERALNIKIVHIQSMQSVQ